MGVRGIHLLCMLGAISLSRDTRLVTEKVNLLHDDLGTGLILLEPWRAFRLGFRWVVWTSGFFPMSAPCLEDA